MRDDAGETGVRRRIRLSKSSSGGGAQADLAQTVGIALPKCRQRYRIELNVVAPAMAGATVEYAPARCALLRSNDNRFGLAHVHTHQHARLAIHDLYGRAIPTKVDHAQGSRIHRHAKQVSVRDAKGTGQNQSRHARMRDDHRAASPC